MKKTDIELLSEVKPTHPYDEFLKEKRIDLTDYEYAGTFPMYSEKSQKWTVISRGKAWQMYSQWLHDKYSSLPSFLRVL